jgi:RNA polymerase sigma-70 factor, ECF subfamily
VSQPILADVAITELIQRWATGELAARDQLMRAAYDQIQIIARQSLKRQDKAALSATELAHEAVLKLLGSDPKWEDRKHFFHVVAQATRQVLVDGARKRLMEKHGGGHSELSLSAADRVETIDDEKLLHLNDALEALSRLDPRRAQVIELSYFTGLPREDIALQLELSVPTVDRDLSFGRAWLKAAMSA